MIQGTNRTIAVMTLVGLLAAIFLGPGPAVAGQSCDELESAFATIENQPGYEIFIEEHKPCELAFVAVQRLAAIAVTNKDWPAAAAIYRKYRSSFPDMAERFANIIELLEDGGEGLVARNLGEEVNTARSEFRPVINAAGDRLYFARDRGGAAGNEDVYVSEFSGRYWRKGRNMGAPVSTDSFEMPLGVSADSTRMTLFGNYPGSLGRGDIFYVELGDLCAVSVNPFPPPINSEFFDSDAMLAADGRTMLFVSERPGSGGVGAFHPKDALFHGSYGGNTDIYVYAEKEDGSYGAINLGEVINTPYSEYSPFLHPDGKTLYFSSDGHYGLGGLDVFKSTRLSDTSWTEWSTPVNLGKEINGPHNDWGYQIDTPGETAYFSALGRLDGFGGHDLYAVELPAKVRPLPVVKVAGRVIDPAGRPLAAMVKWDNLTLDKTVGEAKSDPQTGAYFILLAAGNRYGYYAEKEGYVGRSENIDLSTLQDYREYTVDIILHPIRSLVEELVLRLNNVFFDFDKDVLRSESFLELDRWAAFLASNPEVRVEVRGHTDSWGNEAYNQDLSERRAWAVVDYLTGKGIAPTGLAAVGMGESRPLATNDNAPGRQQNRRVEIVLAPAAAK